MKKLKTIIMVSSVLLAFTQSVNAKVSQYYENGNQKIIKIFSGHEIKTIKKLFKSGEVELVAEFKDGIQISAKRYRKDGTIKTEVILKGEKLIKEMEYDKKGMLI